ncbi:MAG: LD-carboxypeptidase [Bacteroidota bacterium]|jgi:muramoyltetrapeptide carboxypeptidase
MLPPFLNTGDTIGIAATARYLTSEQWKFAKQEIESWGLKILLAENVFQSHAQLAGNEAERTNSFLSLWNNPEVKAIIIARGGYGTVHTIDSILPQLDHRKWVCGYSDVTVLLNAITNKGEAGIHSTMPISFEHATHEALSTLKQALFGELKNISWETKNAQDGCIEGEIVGGNLSVIYSQLGSPTQLESKDKIIFLEDVDEMLYHLDRMLMGLLRAGVFQGAKGIVFGGFTQLKDNTTEFGFSTDNPWGKSWKEVAIHRLQHLKIPMIFDFPAGHMEDNRAFYMGRKSSLSWGKDNAQLSWS